MLSELTARGFRNLRGEEWRPGKGSHLLLGGNGAGKTSLLEAIYVLATTRSFRAPQLRECLQHGQDSFCVEAEVERDQRSHVAVGWGQGGTWRRLNGSGTSVAEHLAVLPVVGWHTGEVEVLAGPPEARRRLLDRGLVGQRPARISVVQRYRRALKQKRELLQRRHRGLESWNRVLSEAAAELIALRADYVQQLTAALSGALARIGLGLPEIGLDYRCSPAAGLAGAAAIEESLARIRGEEQRQGVPLEGPHRDRLEFRWGAHGLRQVASAGERKVLGMALLMAQGDLLVHAGREPLYLLDDADSELAEGALEAVWRVFSEARMVIASSNRGGVWEALRIERRWLLEDGRIKAV